METWKLGNPTSADFTNPTSFISVDCKKKKNDEYRRQRKCIILFTKATTTCIIKKKYSGQESVNCSTKVHNRYQRGKGQHLSS